MNKAILLGRLGQDPETRQVAETSVTKFSLATSEKYKNKQGEVVESTQWHNVEAWGKQGEVLAKHLAKGDQVAIEGRILYDKYEKDGQKRTATKIRLQSFSFVGGGKQVSKAEPQANPAPAMQATANSEDEDTEDTEDDLPF